MTEVTIALFAPVLVMFVVLMTGERVVAACVAVVSFVWSILSE